MRMPLLSGGKVGREFCAARPAAVGVVELDLACVLWGKWRLHKTQFGPSEGTDTIDCLQRPTLCSLFLCKAVLRG